MSVDGEKALARPVYARARETSALSPLGSSDLSRRRYRKREKERLGADGSNVRRVGLCAVLSADPELYRHYEAPGAFGGATVTDPWATLRSFETMLTRDEHCDAVVGVPTCSSRLAFRLKARETRSRFRFLRFGHDGSVFWKSHTDRDAHVRALEIVLASRLVHDHSASNFKSEFQIETVVGRHSAAAHVCTRRPPDVSRV